MTLRYGEKRDGGGSNEVRGRGGGKNPLQLGCILFFPKDLLFSSPLTANEKLLFVFPPGCISSIWFFSMSSLQVVYR